MSMNHVTTGPTVGNAPRRKSGTLFGKTLQELRHDRKLTQNELGSRCGLDHSTLARFEMGDRNPKRETVEKLCWALKLDDDDTDALHMSAGFTTDRITRWWNRDMRPRRAR